MQSLMRNGQRHPLGDEVTYRMYQGFCSVIIEHMVETDGRDTAAAIGYVLADQLLDTSEEQAKECLASLVDFVLKILRDNREGKSGETH
jgi:hypothetical protein